MKQVNNRIWILVTYSVKLAIPVNISLYTYVASTNYTRFEEKSTKYQFSSVLNLLLNAIFNICENINWHELNTVINLSFGVIGTSWCLNMYQVWEFIAVGCKSV